MRARRRRQGGGRGAACSRLMPTGGPTLLLPRQEVYRFVREVYVNLFCVFHPARALQAQLFWQELQNAEVAVRSGVRTGTGAFAAVLEAMSRPSLKFTRLFEAPGEQPPPNTQQPVVVEVEGTDCYEALTVSSNQSNASRLQSEGGSVWESNGPSGTHWIQLAMLPDVFITDLTMVCTTTDSYRPSRVTLKVGADEGELTTLGSPVNCDAVRVDSLIPLLSDCEEHYPIVRMCIAADGINCRINAIKVCGMRHRRPACNTVESLCVAGQVTGELRKHAVVSQEAEKLSPYGEFVINHDRLMGFLPPSTKQKSEDTAERFRELTRSMIAMVGEAQTDLSDSMARLLGSTIAELTSSPAGKLLPATFC